MKHSRLLAATALLGVCACSGPGGNPAASPVVPARSREFARNSSSSPIQHVVFIVQENRSFNNLFLGYPGAKTQNYGYDSRGDKIALQSIHLSTTWDIYHSSSTFFAACNGTGNLPGTKCRMNGFDQELAGPGAPKDFAYASVPQSDVQPYWTMANQYVLADKMFPSNLDASFIAHQYIVAAFASHGVDYPSLQWGCEGGPRDTVSTLTKQRTYGNPIPACFDNPTIADEANNAGLTWRFYSVALSGKGGIWSAFQADSNIYNGPQWKTNVISPPSQFLTDIGNGNLANITWITPAYGNSDHPGFQAAGGPAWVASVVNAIGKSPFWQSTAIFIMWDDPGGWFDPVKPPFKDYDGLGFRVPLIAISAYAKQGYVTHVQYETSSVLKYIEDNFGLGQLAASDRRAKDPATDVFDYTQAPRKFKPIGGSKPNAYWIRFDRHWANKPPPKSLIGDD